MFWRGRCPITRAVSAYNPANGRRTSGAPRWVGTECGTSALNVVKIVSDNTWETGKVRTLVVGQHAVRSLNLRCRQESVQRLLLTVPDGRTQALEAQREVGTQEETPVSQEGPKDGAA